VILSAGLSPAWQQILVFDGFRYGEVNRAAEAHWCGSGKVLNAGIAAHRLGGPSLSLAPLGGPPLGQIEDEFRQLGIPHRWIETASATRVCTTILDRATGTMTELVENGRPLLPAEIEAFCHAYAEEAARAEVAVLIGSLPAGAPVALYRRLIEQTPCPAVLDFRGEGLLSVLDLKPHVVKPNREELAQTVGKPLGTDADLCAAMQGLNHRGAHWVVVTQGAGPVWVSTKSNVYRVHPLLAEEVVNPIGCGDAMAAAIAWAIRDGREMLEAVRLGVAAAAENLRHLLPCRLDPAAVQRLAEQVRVEEGTTGRRDQWIAGG
jgi:1-phosphofructokinase family hexose kinase